MLSILDYTLVMSLGAKKFDPYLLPAYLILDVWPAEWLPGAENGSPLRARPSLS